MEAAKKKEEKPEELTLEKAFDRLEKTIGNLQRQDITLEDAFAEYEKGMALLKLCSSKIDLVEKKVTELSGEGDEIGFS